MFKKDVMYFSFFCTNIIFHVDQSISLRGKTCFFCSLRLTLKLNAFLIRQDYQCYDGGSNPYVDKRLMDSIVLLWALSLPR